MCFTEMRVMGHAAISKNFLQLNSGKLGACLGPWKAEATSDDVR